MGQQKPQLAIIRVISGPEAGQEFPVHGSAVTLGRTRDCEICIQDGMLSRRHCRLFLKNSEWLLEDLDSTNGTFVGGAQVRQPTPVNGTLRFRAGASLFEAEVSQRQSADTPTIAFRLDSRDPLMATQADSSGNDFPLANALELHEKMAYPDFLEFVIGAERVVTDSGGLQEECGFLEIPCLVHRKATERFDGIGQTARLSLWKAGAIREFVSMNLPQSGPNEQTRRLSDENSPTEVIIQSLTEMKLL